MQALRAFALAALAVSAEIQYPWTPSTRRARRCEVGAEADPAQLIAAASSGTPRQAQRRSL